jgi:hypothetical protein
MKDTEKLWDLTIGDKLKKDGNAHKALLESHLFDLELVEEGIQ